MLVLALVVSAGTLLPARSATAALTVGLERGVAEASDRNRDMRQLGLTASLDIPLRRPLGRSWLLGTQVSARGGSLTGWGDKGFYAAAGFRVNITAVRTGVSIEWFTGPIHISRIHFGGADFGIRWQLLNQVGFSTRISRLVSLGYRFQHMSNVGLERSNPGLDSHVFRLEVRLGGNRPGQ